MGIKGTDVTKEVSDMILTDDNFATIVDTVREGRGVYDNIRKFIKLLLSTNFDEIMEISIAIFAGLPLPLLPLQILWINVVTDGLPALALSVDPKDPHIMKRKPRDPKKGIIDGMIPFILVAVMFDLLCTIALFMEELDFSGNLDKARTIVFTETIMFELLFVFNCRSEKSSVFKTNILSNKKLIYAVILSIILQISIIYIPIFQSVFKTVPLTIIDWIKIILFSIPALFVFPEVLMNKEIKFSR
jgi:Ca2+-transporting ATPase